MKRYEYKEVVMDMKKDMLMQLNEEGQQGWQFIIQAQKIDPTKKQLTVQGMQPKVEIVMIFKRELPEVITLKN